ncbi:hypothetical protein CLCAR_0201 [Clostridium carboxidivorans P7]|nr:hypothetical protein CLCAR_0201 [Clostridium carboxidivorans P7]
MPYVLIIAHISIFFTSFKVVYYYTTLKEGINAISKINPTKNIF